MTEIMNNISILNPSLIEIFNNINDGIVTVNLNNIILSINLIVKLKYRFIYYKMTNNFILNNFILIIYKESNYNFKIFFNNI